MGTRQILIQSHMKAIVLAAGEGSILSPLNTDKTPGPLTCFGGISLLERTVRNLAGAGISEFIIVVGYRGEEVIKVTGPRLNDLKVQWVKNKCWIKGSGTSVLAARPYLGNEPFLVSMSDHWIQSSTLKSLISRQPEPLNTLMAIDLKKDVLTDPDDAMKVKIKGPNIISVAKKLVFHDGIDIGVAICTPGFFDELEEAKADSGSCTHSDGMQRLASKGRLLFHDIGPDRWEDVDTLDSLQTAEKLLLTSLRKPTDGFFSRMLERHISLAVTRLLAKTSIIPNYVTGIIICIGAAAGFLFSQSGMESKVFAALLFWCSSFLDGCDGELARLKFMETRLGGWLDLWADNLIHSMVFMGMGIGIYRDTDNIIWVYLGSCAVLGVLFSVGWVSLKILWGKRSSGPLYKSVSGDTTNVNQKNWLKLLTRLADALSRRDFIFGLIFITALGWLPYFLWAAAIGSNFYFIILLIIHFSDRQYE